MPARKLTNGEKGLLIPVFKHALPYDDLEIDRNDYYVGGEYNSITPFGTPYMATKTWSTDYSGNSVMPSTQWVFIHEFAHVWQYHSGMNKVVEAVVLWFVTNNYEEDAYKYDLSKSSNLDGFTFEAQAAIIADYWYVKNGNAPSNSNVGTAKAEKDYIPFMNQLWNSKVASNNRRRDGKVWTPVNRR